MGKKDVNNEISEENLLEIIGKLEDAIDFAKSMIGEKPPGKSEESEESKIVVGSLVKWEDKDGDDQEGEVLKIKEDTATVEDDDGDEHKVDLADLKLATSKKSDPKSGKESKKEAKIEVGSEVEWEDKDGDSHEGEVIKIKGDVATVEDDNGDEHKVGLDDLELA